jgi:hypothetical protein
MERYFVAQPYLIDEPWREIEDTLKQAIKNYDSGQLKQYLDNYSLPRGDKLKSDGSLNRPIMKAILEYDAAFSKLLPSINTLDGYCSQRNNYVHDLRGVAQVNNPSEITKNLRKILHHIDPLPKLNPFDLLNETICFLLDENLRGQS